MISENDMFKYLTELRDSGNINMMGSIPYLMDEFDLERKEASKVFGNWQIHLSKPHCEDCE